MPVLQRKKELSTYERKLLLEIEQLQHQVKEKENHINGLESQLEKACFDISSLKRRLEHHSRQWMEQHEQSKFLKEELTGFAYVLDHQLKSPLRNIIGFLQLLNRHYYEKMDDRGKEYLSFATKNALHFNALLEDLTFFHSLTSKKTDPRPILSEVTIRQVISQLDVEIQQANAQINVEEMPLLWAHPVLFHHLVKELLRNAIKFRGKQDPVIWVNAIYDANDFVMKIKDNGIGIPTSYMSKVFKLFERLHHSSNLPGTGLGLALCKKIVDLHQGSISFLPNKEEGITVVVRIPMKKAF